MSKIKSSQPIVTLVNLWAKHEQENPDLTIEAFCWNILGESSNTPDTTPFSINARLAGLAGRLSKFATLYAKKALNAFDFSNVEEWVYLVRLQQMGKPKKSELIFELLSEFPSGTEIIKRLIKKELVKEYPDEEDRRSKRVTITDKGIQLLGQSFPEMERVGQMAFGILSPVEKNLFLMLLEKLDTHHNEHYRMVRQATFQEAYDELTLPRIAQSDSIS